MQISSDPHAWLRPPYAKLASDPAFARLAPAHQFRALCEAAAKLSPSKALQMREWNSATQISLLHWLASIVEEQPNPRRETALWRVSKNGRELRCVAVYLSSGIDLRLLDGDDFRRTQLVKDAPAVEELANGWRNALVERGWTLC
jgi:hypothetical protein